VESTLAISFILPRGATPVINTETEGATMRLFWAFGVVAILLAGCARTSVMPLAADTLEVTTSAAPVCGAAGAQEVAIHRAAVETIRAGFDRFTVLNSGGQDNVGVIGYTPLTATTYGSPGYATTTVYGGAPIIAGSHDESVVIKMYHAGDPGGADAISARSLLGPNWSQEVSASNPSTCTS
jgi:hypothetical protein